MGGDVALLLVRGEEYCAYDWYWRDEVGILTITALGGGLYGIASVERNFEVEEEAVVN